MSKPKTKLKTPPRREAAAAEPPAPGVFGRFPRTVALVFLFLSLVIFFWPMLFGGKVFLPPDNIASQSHQPYIQEVQATGEYPLWTPYLFSGMPSLGSLIAAPFTNPMSLVLTPLGPNLKLISYYFLIGLFTFFLARRRVRSNFAALFAAVAFVYCAHVIGWVMAGHNSKLATCVFMPAILLLVDRLLEKPSITTAAWAALAIGLSIVTSHMQITFYAMMAAGLLLLVMTIFRLRAREAGRDLWLAWGLFAVAAVVGLGASAVVSLPVREYSEYSIRGAAGAGLTRDYATNWSLHPFETLTFLIPSFFGFGNPTYWGWMPFTDAPQYMGILPLFLAVAGVALRRRERFTIFLLVIAFLGLLISFGKEFPILYDPLFNFLPFFNKFRVPSMALVLTQLAVAVLAALAIDALLEPVPEAERRRRAGLFGRVTLIFGAVLLVAGLVVLGGRGWLTGLATAKIGAGAATEAVAMAGRDFLKVMFFFAIGAGFLWGVARRSVPRLVALPVVLLVTMADLWIVGLESAHYQTPAARTNVFQPTGTVQFIKQDPDLFRILPLQSPLAPSPNWWAYFKLQNAYGYHPAKIKIYQDMLDDQGPLGLTKPLAGGNFNFLRIANVRYLIMGQPGLEGSAHLDLAHTAEGVAPTGQRVREYTYRLVEELPRAFFVNRYRVIADETALLTAMADPAWDPADEALLMAEPGSAIDPGAGGTARVTEHKPHHLKAELNSPGNSLLVLSEVYYPPGWKATLDGREVPILRTNYAFRGIVVPAGTHTLAMDFSDPAYVSGKTVSLASYGLIAAAILGGFLLDRRRRAGAFPPAGTESRPPASPKAEDPAPIRQA
jgi:hypothetical protein